MTDEQVTALLSHPRVQRTIRSLANAEARSLIEHYVSLPEARIQWVTYREAARLLGVKEQTIRLYVCYHKLEGGNGRITKASLDILIAKKEAR